jgi:hypothetical protein
MKKFVGTAGLLCLILTVSGFAQSVNSTIGGTVQDATGAFIPGVTITVTNTQTGVAATTISNEAGAYQFASLSLGTYNITAELPGFATRTVKEYQLGGGVQARINFTLEVASATGTTIDVNISGRAAHDVLQFGRYGPCRIQDSRPARANPQHFQSCARHAGRAVHVGWNDRHHGRGTSGRCERDARRRQCQRRTLRKRRLVGDLFDFEGYTQVVDPSYTPVTTNGLNAGYTNKAILAPNGQVILVNPQPGELGTLGYTPLRGPGETRLDMNMVKRFRIHETREFEFRVDAINVLNTPNFAAPNVAMNATGNAFGRITGAAGARRFVVNARVNF